MFLSRLVAEIAQVLHSQGEVAFHVSCIGHEVVAHPDALVQRLAGSLTVHVRGRYAD